LVEAPDAAERSDAIALRTQLTPTVPVPAPPAPPAPRAPAQTTPSGGTVWSVQIAAFQTAAEAATFAAEIRARGYDTRVDGSTAPFRVRFGRYATRTAAVAAMDAYKSKEQSDAFLAQVPR
jgi:cell division protein FtsN